MKKSTKLVVLVAALVALFSLTAFAAKGWVAEDGNWYYYGTDGEKVDSCWKQANGKWYYLGEDCAMVTSQLVDYDGEYYYVDETGARVTGWQLLPALEDDETGEENRYYYFQSSGKAVRGATKKINGKTYAFDEEGRMMFGCVANNAMINDTEDAILSAEYYFGEANDGAMQTKWFEYTEGFVSHDYDDVWFYFGSDGKKYTDDNGICLINKKYYAFKEDGVMVTGWQASATDAGTDYHYFDPSTGAEVKSGWKYVTASHTTGAKDDAKWFYLSSYTKQVDKIITVSKKYYALNTEGIMKAGLIQVDTGEIVDLREGGKIVEAGLTDYTATDLKKVDLTKGGLYYFSNDSVNDGAAKTGTIKIDLADAEYTFVFNKYTYAANHGVVDSILYDHGMLQAASTYAVKSCGSDNYFVDSKGKLVTKTGKYTDGDGNVWVVDGDAGVLYYIAYSDYKYEENKTVKYATASKVGNDLLTAVKKTGDAKTAAIAAFDAKYDKDAADFKYTTKTVKNW